MHEVQLREAKATLSAVIDRAENGEPTIVTRHGIKAAVILGFDEWKRLSDVPSFGRLLMSLPEGAPELFDRDQTPHYSSELVIEPPIGPADE